MGSSQALGTVFSVNPASPACAPYATQLGRGTATGLVLNLSDFSSTTPASGASSPSRQRSFTSQVCLTNIAR